jgi:predicted nuclease of predicted toxin-antitoxin system
MKFLANMGISPLTVTFLRDRDHDALHLHEQELDRLPDPDILEKARSEDRVLLTTDLDFADLLAHSHAQLPSVILFRLRDMRPDNVNEYLTRVLDRFSQELATGAVISVTERELRVRSLPIRRE